MNKKKRQHNKGELSITTSGYIEDIEKIVDITIKSMRQEDAEKDDCRLNYMNNEELKRIMNRIKKRITAEKNENQLNKDKNKLGLS